MENNYTIHAKREFEYAGFINDGEYVDEYQQLICENVLDILDTINGQGHSGFSHGYMMSMLNKLVDFKPISPLSFKDKEWVECGNNIYQNKRNSSVFKEGYKGRPYYIDAYSKVTNDYGSWGGTLELDDGRHVRRCYIKDSMDMPTVKILVDTFSTGLESHEWDMKPVNESILDELKLYYDLEIS